MGARCYVPTLDRFNTIGQAATRSLRESGKR